MGGKLFLMYGKQGFQTGREGEMVQLEKEGGNCWKNGEMGEELGENVGIAPERQSCLQFLLLCFKTILSCCPPFSLHFYLSLSPLQCTSSPQRSSLYHPPHLSFSLFFSLIFFLWIIYCGRGEWKCVYFERVCALNRMLNDCRWERDCINPIYVETF